MENNSTRPFCDASMPMTMYMDGFRSPLLAYLFHQSDANTTTTVPPPCLNFLFRDWTLDTPYKFIMVMAAVTMLGIGVEVLAAIRSGGTLKSYFLCHRHRRRRSTPIITDYQRWILQSAVVGSHVLQALIGYVLMLAAMSYSAELFCCALLGLGIGYAMCFEAELLPGWDVGDDIDDDDNGDEDAEDDNEDANAPEGDRHRGARATPPRSRRDATTAVNGAGTCCGAGGGAGTGRGPPRRAFRFRSPVPTLGGVRPADRRQSGGIQNGDDSNDGAHPPGFLHVSQEEGADDYLRLQEDDKMTPLL